LGIIRVHQNSGSTQAKAHAALGLKLDFIFFIVYAIFISLACIPVGKSLQER
jgi:hypothetical protein